MNKMDNRDEARYGRGRPTKDDSRRKVRGVRFDDDEENMIQHLEIETGYTMSDIIRKSVRFYYNYMIKRF